MNISSVNNIKFCSPSFGILRYSSNSLLKPINKDTVEISSKNNTETAEELFDKYLSEKHKFTVKDYKSLSVNSINEIRKICSKHEDVVNAVEETLPAALDIRCYLNKKYFNGDYTLISIGTSPAMICKTLEYMGKKVKYIPITSIRNITMEDIDKLNKDDKRKIPFKNYLEDNGVTPKSIKDGNEHFIFIDYTYTGRSLKNFSEIMERCFNINHEDVEYISLNNLIQYALGYCSKSGEILPDKLCRDTWTSHIKMRKYIDEFLKFDRAEIYGGIPHLNFKELDKISELSDYSSEKSNMFNFLMIDELNKMGKLKHN